jgi:hypothetical protein
MYEMWSLPLREEHMRVFGKRVLRIYGPKKEKECVQGLGGKTRRKETDRESQIQVGG